MSYKFFKCYAIFKLTNSVKLNIFKVINGIKLVYLFGIEIKKKTKNLRLVILCQYFRKIILMSFGVVRKSSSGKADINFDLKPCIALRKCLGFKRENVFVY